MEIRVLFVHGSSNNIAGQELSLVERINALRAQGVYCAAVIPGWGSFYRLLRKYEIPVHLCGLHRFSKQNPLPYARTVFLLQKLIRRNGYSVVHCSGIYPTQYALPAARLSGARCLTHVNSTIYTGKEYRNSLVTRVDAVCAVSEGVRRDILAKTSLLPDEVYTIYNNVVPGIAARRLKGRAELKRALGIPRGYKVVGQVGQIMPRKGLYFFMRMAARIKKRFPRVKFLIVGNATCDHRGYFQSLKKVTGQLGLQDDVIFTGYLPKQKVFRIMDLLDIGVLASVTEGLGRVIVEYSALGKPVVATDIAGPREAVLHNRSGVIVCPRDDQALARAVMRLLRNPGLARRYGEAGKIFVGSRFKHDHSMLHGLYQDMIAAARAREEFVCRA